MTTTNNLIALVTGANRGIGLETSRQLAAKGVTVIMGGRSEASLAAAADTLRAEGLENVVPVILDVTNTQHREAVKAQITKDYGRLDILINNAGIITGESFFSNSSTTVSTESLRQTFEVNVFAPIALAQELLPLLKAAPAARIVNLSSILGSLTTHADPTSPFATLKPLAYDTSKAALNMFSIHLAAALKDTNIKVNSAHPGWVKTDMGTDAAPMNVVDGAKTSVELALLDADGPSGGYFHLGDQLPW